MNEFLQTMDRLPLRPGLRIVKSRWPNPVGLMTDFAKTNSLHIPDRAARFPDRGFGDVYASLDGHVVGFLVYFEDEFITTLEGYALGEIFPPTPREITLMSKQAADAAFLKLS